MIEWIVLGAICLIYTPVVKEELEDRKYWNERYKNWKRIKSRKRG